MSAVEATKPVEAPVVAPTETPTETPIIAESAPVEASTAEPVAVEEPAVASETPAEATEAAVVKEEVKPVEEGILGYKGPGLLKSFIFQKKFFWFGAEAVESKALSSYLRGEKQQELANKNVAWAASTGKGLLFFSKKASEKATPHGVFNLSEISDITDDGTVAFAFMSGGHKHIFEASTLAERDNWVSVLKTKSAEATEMAATVVESEEYKKAHADLLPKAPIVAAAVAKEETKAEKKEEAKEAKEEAKEEKKEEKKEIKEEKKEARKSRSASRKRGSLFGGFNLGGKKEEKTEAAKEDAVVAVPTEEVSAAPVEPVVAAETTEAAAPVVAPEVAPAEKPEKPVMVKRSSIFGNLKFGQNKEKKVEAEAPAVPAKDAEPVSENAPVIPAVEASEPLATTVASPATVPTETVEAPVTNGETKVEAPVMKTDKRKSSLPFFTKKEKVTSDEEAEKPKSPGPFAKLRATVKGKSSPKAEKVADKPAETSAETSAETPVVAEPATAAEPVISEPEPVVSQTTPQVTASA